MKNPWIVIGFLTVFLFGGAVWYSGVASERNNEGVELMAHIEGNPDAVVTLTEYSDLQCPACRSFQPVIKEVLDQYGEQLRFEYKHFPLPTHQFAMQAAVAAEAAGQQGKFFEFVDLVFENQPTWSAATAPATFFVQYADELGLDIETFRKHSNATLLRDKVRTEQAEGRELGITGTPTFFLNGERMTITTYESFVTQIALAINPAGAATTSESAPEASSSGVRFGI